MAVIQETSSSKGSVGEADPRGPFFVKLLFEHRKIWITLLILLTVFLGYQAAQVRPHAGFEKMIPLKHPYIVNFMAHRNDVQGGNIVRVSVEAKTGNIFNKDYLETLREINDELFFLPGVDRVGLKSLWTKNVQWRAVTEEGFDGGIVIDNNYDGSKETLAQVRRNIFRSGQIGRLVANNFKSTVILVPLLEFNPETGEELDYWDLSKKFDEIRSKYNSAEIEIHIIGFAKLLGDMIQGITAAAGFFAIAFAITFILLYAYCRCIRGTIVPLFCSVVAVIWQLGILNMLGYGLDPYSVLVPFLVFAIGISHGVQMINAVAFNASKGLVFPEMSRIELATRQAVRNLFTPGICALSSDAVGFLTLVFIEINIIQELAIAASIGVVLIILSNLIMLPLLIPVVGICETAISHAGARKDKKNILTRACTPFVRAKPARIMVMVAVLLACFGLYASKDLKIGDLDKGAPELRADSQYNKDIEFITENYSTSSDVLIVMVETDKQKSASYEVMDSMDRLQWELENTEGVQSTVSVVNVTKRMSAMLNEGNFRWYALPRAQHAIFSTLFTVPPGFITDELSLSNLFVFLEDHKAETLNRVTSTVENYAKNNPVAGINYLLAAGSSGIEAATNQMIKKFQIFMLIFIYAVVSLMVLATFRSFRAVLCIILPLGLTTILCQALMALLGIGVKVATLPVIALGVGIGVDYGIYIYSRFRQFLDEGHDFHSAYVAAMQTTGRAVAFTGVTLAVGVCTWVFSPIKFQADMGLLLTFMFLWNMLGIMFLLPALAYFFIKKNRFSE
ncbi:MAG: RND family transporter [Deltaproteobacteria bacterium]|nr:RND family transporter [Deltaproteobacteria bacterium]